MQTILQTITPPLSPLGMEVLDCALEGARLNFSADGYLKAALITGNEDPARPGAIIMLANTSPEAKPAMVRFIHQQREQNDACVLVVECWQSILPPSEFGRAYQERITPPSEDPNRTECVMVTLYEGGRIVAFIAEITRQDNGAPTLGDWWVWHDTAATTRPLVGNFAAPAEVN
jgi:hypothetical protein